jgi:hypothetical protein
MITLTKKLLIFLFGNISIHLFKLCYLKNHLPLYKSFMTTIKKKYAVCIYGQLRAVCTIYENLNRHLINELGADLYIVAQDTKTDHLHLFQTENKLIYQPPDVRNIFINYNLLTQRNNYIIDACLQIYYNFHKINEIFGDIFENTYEYIILTRSDYLHICPFPNILNICNNTDLFGVMMDMNGVE